MSVLAVSKRFARNIYLHTGPRVGGIRRDPTEVFTTASGHFHGTNPENLKHIKLFLLDKYAIPDDLALQVLTHKSFGNGIKPYNEKLSTMGSKLLNLTLAKYVVSKQTSNELAINGKNLDVLGTPMAKELGGRMALGVFAKNSKLNTIMFWKSYNSHLSFEQSGELKVSAQMMYALVGAVTFVHGKKAAEQFVEEKLLLGSTSLEAITEELLQNLRKSDA
ncbi:CIC11C00000003819 [Sungouiella intermedia]|uniref:CIC11C00000003819 n=1 Tax=Sungouiella intermedia TaxID=45354 RepID=A0A1L0B7G5_9ASCO|nr:CIC11C00000003819 [[Candida] intermedia]